MKPLPPPQFSKCVHCGHDKSEHEWTNLTDGAFCGKYVLICSTALFKAEKEEK